MLSDCTVLGRRFQRGSGAEFWRDRCDVGSGWASLNISSLSAACCMSEPTLRRIVPIPPPESELFENYQVTDEFYREVQLREEQERYCQWYRQVAEQHRREFEQMQQDINLFGWFCRGRRR